MKRARKLAPKKTEKITPEQLTAIKGGLGRTAVKLSLDEDGFLTNPDQ